MNAAHEFFATCPKGLESLLNAELAGLGAESTRETVAGVYFSGGLQVAYRACLWSRLANKILMPLVKGAIASSEDLYRLVRDVEWESHFQPAGSLLVDFLGTNDLIRNTQFGAQAVKDGIVDRLREQTGERPAVAKISPDFRINARLAKGVLHLGLDLSGESLHRRGYRQGQGEAPLKENLAAAILLRCGWPEIAANDGALIDPMCGSGTLLIEGAMLAADMAPGLQRERFGFERWKRHDRTLWDAVRREAEHRKQMGLLRELPEIRGYDADPRVLDAAQANIEAAELEGIVRVSRKTVAEFKKPTHRELNPGLVVCNPPYGERLGEVEALREIYRTLAQVVKAELPGWQLGVFTGNSDLGRELRLRAKKKYKLFNGTIPSELLLFDIVADDEATLRKESAEETKSSSQSEILVTPTEAVGMVVNRLKKNRKRLAKWVEKNNIECYRVYDADMPEYAAAIDIYGGHIHVQGYAAPKTVDENKARKRFDELLQAVVAVFQTGRDSIAIKTRQRNRGKQQYEKLTPDTANKNRFFVVREGPVKLLVNLYDYLDTGLFLDHRPLRKMIGASARGKTFLNLFCYTGTATVHAAVGGAVSSVSVDMSNTYLHWASQNFALNNIHPERHKLIREDCMTWLKACRQGFDIIMLDPPTFSNSKKMDDVLDIQRDHVALIKRCMEILNPGGVLYFSNNLRSFKLDSEALADFRVKDITEETLDKDFERNKKIHSCWKIQNV